VPVLLKPLEPAGRAIGEALYKIEYRGLHVEYAERRTKYGILFIFCLEFEYINLEYVRIHVIYRINRRNTLFAYSYGCATGIRKKINRSQTHTHTDREQYPRHRHTHTTRTTPQTPKRTPPTNP